MVRGTLRYACEVSGYIFRSFDPLEVATTEPWVEKLVLECRNETPIEITVAFASAPSDTAFISAKAICRTLVARLAMQYGLCVQEPMLVAHELEETRAGQTTKVIAGGVPLICGGGKDSKRIEPQDLPGLKADLEDLRPHTQDYEELFRIAMQSDDTVDRYMSLYRILSLLFPNPQKKEEQKYVDNFIELETNERRRFKRPDKPNILETVYTKLRNEVGHAREGVDLAVTRREMESRVYELAALVKKAIETKK